MALQFLAGQRLTADALQRAVPDRVVQGSNQSVTSSVALADSEIVITVDDLVRIDLEIRWRAEGGGIRWDWAGTGSVSLISRYVGAPGNATSGSPNNIADMFWRDMTNLGDDVALAQFTTSVGLRGAETLVVDGSGTLTFRFAQETSNANATSIAANVSYATVTRLGS
jgi:hypothetical protein